ncbi:MAG: hypothetical protein ACJ8E2_16195 [Bradyrhizobium sp.]
MNEPCPTASRRKLGACDCSRDARTTGLLTNYPIDAQADAAQGGRKVSTTSPLSSQQQTLKQTLISATWRHAPEIIQSEVDTLAA